MRIDHVIYAARNVSAAAADLRSSYGLVAVAGGRHEGLGTENAIIPLGQGYLEILAIHDPETAAANPLGRRVRDATRDGDELVSWVLAVDDIDAVATRLGLTVAPGERRRPDGTSLQWRSAGLEQALAEPGLPFFIEWDPSSDHPSQADARHVNEVHGIDWIELGGDESRIREWIGETPLPYRIVHEEPGVYAVHVRASVEQHSFELRTRGPREV